jgi:hypothetical protein
MEWKRNGKVIDMPITDYLSNIFDEELEKGIMLSVSVGTDSQKVGKGHKFATVILIVMTQDLGGGVIVGRGGKIISTTHIHAFKTRNKEVVNEKMVYEVGKSIEVAYEIAPLLDLYEIKLEIHADINPDPRWESNKALQAAVGYILGMGYDFKIKPDSYAASNCADKICH